MPTPPSGHLFPLIGDVVRVKGLLGPWEVVGIWSASKSVPWHEIWNASSVPVFYSVRSAILPFVKQVVAQQDITEIVGG